MVSAVTLTKNNSFEKNITERNMQLNKVEFIFIIAIFLVETAVKIFLTNFLPHI